jgi:hypothetical protein
MLREAIRALNVEDVLARTEAVLAPGAVLSGCRLRRRSSAEIASGADVYVVEFQSAGRRYHCPLYRFQPRTQWLDAVQVEEDPAREAVAV